MTAKNITKKLTDINDDINLFTGCINKDNYIQMLKEFGYEHQLIKQKSNTFSPKGLKDIKDKSFIYTFNIDEDHCKYINGITWLCHKKCEEVHGFKVPKWNNGTKGMEKSGILYIGTSNSIVSRMNVHIKGNKSKGTYGLRLSKFQDMFPSLNEYNINLFYISKSEEHKLINKKIEHNLHEILQPAIGNNR